MKFLWKKLLNFFAILSIPCLITPALTPTVVARYAANSPLVRTGQQNWNYPAWMAENNSLNYQNQAIQPSPKALEETQNYLAQASNATATTEWQQPREIIRPVYVANSQVMPFNQPSSGMQRFNKPSSWFGQRNYFKDSQDRREIVPNQRLSKKGLFDDRQALKKSTTKKEEMTEQQYFLDQQDRYAHRKQMLEDQLSVLLTKYSLGYMTQQEVEQQEKKLLVSLNRDLDLYLSILQEQIKKNLGDIMNAYNLEKEALRRQKIEKQGYPGLTDFAESKSLSTLPRKMDEEKNDLLDYEYSRPSVKIRQLEKKLSEHIIPLEEQQEIYYDSASAKRVSRPPLMEMALPVEEKELTQEPIEFEKTHKFSRPSLKVERLKQEPEEFVVPLEEQEEIYYDRASTKRASRPPLMEMALPVEDEDSIQEPVEQFEKPDKFSRPSVKIRQLEKKLSEHIVPLEEQQEIYYDPASTKRVSRPSLIEMALPVEEKELIQEPIQQFEKIKNDQPVQEFITKQPEASSKVSSVVNSRSVFRTEQEKKLMRDLIHDKHAPFLKNKLRQRKHRGMITKNLIANLIREYNLNILHPDDISYTQGVLQANFM